MSILTTQDRPSQKPPSLEGRKRNPFRGQQRRGYGRAFWMAYVSNFLISVAVAVLYRYVDFVGLLGGSEYQLGWIVGVGMVGSLIGRMAIGNRIDRRGPKVMWLISLLSFTLICWAHLGLSRPDTPAIYLLRVAYCFATAAVFGSAMIFVSGEIPVVRVAEMIGMLGTAGFIGTVLGTHVGDWVCSTDQLTRVHGNRLFLVAGLVGLIATVFAAMATSEVRPPVIRHRRPPIVYLLLKYHPGAILAVAVIAGAAVGWPSTFLVPYAAGLGIPRIGTFFTIYSITDVLTRVITRRWPERFGFSPFLLAGLGILALSQPLFLLVQNEWAFIVPGLAYGLGEALLFPSIVAAGCRTFPKRYRGLGTMVMMLAFDLGTMLVSPLVGTIIYYAPEVGLPTYPTLFVLLGVLLGVAAGFYALVAPPEGAKKARDIRFSKTLSLPAQTAPLESLEPISTAEALSGVPLAESLLVASKTETPARVSKSESPEVSREGSDKNPAPQTLQQAG